MKLTFALIVLGVVAAIAGSYALIGGKTTNDEPVAHPFAYHQLVRAEAHATRLGAMSELLDVLRQLDPRRSETSRLRRQLMTLLDQNAKDSLEDIILWWICQKELDCTSDEVKFKAGHAKQLCAYLEAAAQVDTRLSENDKAWVRQQIDSLEQWVFARWPRQADPARVSEHEIWEMEIRTRALLGNFQRKIAGKHHRSREDYAEHRRQVAWLTNTEFGFSTADTLRDLIEKARKLEPAGQPVDFKIESFIALLEKEQGKTNCPADQWRQKGVADLHLTQGPRSEHP